MTAAAIGFWASSGLLLYADFGYPALLAGLLRFERRRRRLTGRTEQPSAADRRETVPPGSEASDGPGPLPLVSVIVPAYAEEKVIARRVANLKSLDYPRELLEILVCCDGSPDGTAELARAAGADVVLDLPREGKVRAQDAGVARSQGEVLAFGDANSVWDPGALRALVAALADPRVGYVCGDVRIVKDAGTNQEGVYWRYEMAIRRLESELRSVTAGNGAIYATKREAYIHVDPIMGHDLSFPFNMVKRGWRAVYEPRARAIEKMVPTIEGEFSRKRRIMGHTWPIIVRGGLLSPRGYDPMYALMIFSHRGLRYLSPVLHLGALGTSILLVRHGWIYATAAGLQLAVLLAAGLAPLVPARPMLLARYYVLTTASLVAGLWDWLVRGTSGGWDPIQEMR